jgi:glycerate-2-kinase
MTLSSSNPIPNATDAALAIWKAGLAAVDAQRLVIENFRLERDAGELFLALGEATFAIDGMDDLLVIGAGKAAAAMAAGLESAIDAAAATIHPRQRFTVRGSINVPAGTERPLKSIRCVTARPAGVNEPTAEGVEGSREILRLVSNAGQRTGCIALISGGGSALLPLPIDGISLDEKLAVTRWLSGAGANIEQLNTVRKQLSGIKGGKVAAACHALWLHTLVISDVLGDPLDLIASGPTVIDRSRPQDALDVLAQFDPQRQLPAAIYRVLETAAERGDGQQREQRLPGRRPCPATISVIGNNAVAVDACGMEAERLGLQHAMTSAQKSEGAAEEVGRHLAEMALSMLSASGGDASDELAPNCLISGGEPVVRLVDESVRGRGGRNQQLALAALRRLMEEPPDVQQRVRSHVALVSAGTDGEDGPTDAAGALVDGRVWQKMESEGLQPTDFLIRNDAYTFFHRTGGLIKTGPTGTNVCDVRVVVVRP